MAFPYDQSFKLLSDEDAAGSLQLVAGIQLPPGAEIESLDREINPERLHADHLYRVRVDNEVFIHHFEALTYNRAGWADAQMDHAIYVRMKYRMPVYSHLLLLHERGVPPIIENVIVRDSGSLHQRLTVNIIRLWERPAASVLATNSVVLYPWTALMDASVEQQQEAARRLEATGRESLKLQMALLGALRYGSRETFLRRLGRMFLTKAILKESPLWQEIEREGRAEGKAEGRAQGKAEGKEEGLAEGERRAVTRFLVGRFGPLPEWASEKLRMADLKTLEQWAERAATSTSLDSALE